MRVTVLIGALACALGMTVVVADPAAEPAFAGCEARSIEQLRDEADATVIGTIVEIDRPRRWFGTSSSGDPVTYWIQVSQVFDGAAHAVIEVTSEGYPLDAAADGRSYLLFVRGESPTFTSDGCSSIPMPIGVPEDAQTLAGWESMQPQPGGAELPRVGVPWGTVGFGAIVVALVVVVVRDARRRSLRGAA